MPGSPTAGLTLRPYYEDESVTLYHGDCREVLPTLAPGSASLIVADPPYHGVKDEWWDQQFADDAAFVGWIGERCDEWRTVLRPNGSLYVFASPRMAAAVECKVGETFNVLNRITWRKPEFSTKAEMFDKDTSRTFFPASEAIIFAEPPPMFASIIERERVKAGLSRQDVSERVVGTRSGACWNWEAGIRTPTLENWQALRDVMPNLPEYHRVVRPFRLSDRVPYTDVWTFRTVNTYPGKHPCEKPLPMIEHMVGASSNPDDIVVDPFAGYGATLQACRNLGRVCIGIEMNERYCEIAANRLRQGVLFGAGEVA